MFPKNDWYMACWSDELTDRPLGRTIAGEPLVLFRDGSGKVAALRDQCIHRGVSLSPGRVIRGGIECPYHGLVYDGTGRCVHIPTQDHIPTKAVVRSFAAREQHAIVWVWAGKAEEADDSKIVPYPWHDDARWPYRKGYLHVRCSYEMLLDNIMDLTHLPYVHPHTIGGGSQDDHTKAVMKTERTDRGVKFARWLLDSVTPPMYTKVAGLKGKIDRWQEEELIVPSVIVQFTGGVDVAQDAYHGGSRESGFGIRVLHAIVPETDVTCHYSFSVALGSGPHDPAMMEALLKQTLTTLQEDVIICEDQQSRMSQFPDTTLVDLRSDEARLLYRRHLVARVAAEGA
jgi:phenylpropionate dioxygenase-like ring-hydroxylating dioxygenase large terminal subunit